MTSLSTEEYDIALKHMAAAERVVIGGGPNTGKTTLSKVLEAGNDDLVIMHTDVLVSTDLDWSEQSAAVAGWFTATDLPWVIEGVATVRALRKFMKTNAEKPCDMVVWLTQPVVPVTEKQETMAKGAQTIFDEIEAELVGRGVTIIRM